MPGRQRCAQRDRGLLGGVERRHHAPGDAERVGIVLGVMVGHAGGAGVHIRAAQLLGGDDFAGGRLHQRRAGEKDGALVAHDDGLVGHRRHIGAAGGAGAHDHGDLRDAGGGEIGLVEEDAAEMLAVGKHLVLRGQVGAAGIHQVDAGQTVARGDLLRAQVLLDRHRVVAAAFDRRVVADDHAFPAGDAADAGDDAGAGHLVAVHAVRRQLRKFEERRAGIEQRVDAFAWQQLAAPLVAGARRGTAAQGGTRGLGAQVGDQRGHGLGVRTETVAARIGGRGQDHQAVSRNSSRPISMRRISLVPAPISYSLASRSRRPVGVSLM